MHTVYSSAIKTQENTTKILVCLLYSKKTLLELSLHQVEVAKKIYHFILNIFQ